MITRRPLMTGSFADAEPGRTSLISTADWEQHFPTLPLYLYLAEMLVGNIPYLSLSLSDQVQARQWKRHARTITGCIGDYCPKISDIWQNMLRSRVCASCRREFIEAGLSEANALAIDELCKIVRELSQRYDRRFAPDGFISYNWKDQKFAEKLAKDLQDRGVKFFLDKQQIEVGDSLVEKVLHGVIHSRFFVPILSPDSVSSRWCRKELRTAISREIKGKMQILPILYRDCRIPPFLDDTLRLDVRAGGYPEALAMITAKIKKHGLRRGQKPRKISANKRISHP